MAKFGTTENLYMVFNMDDTKTHNIILPNPKANLTETETENVMTDIITKQALLKGTAKAASINETYKRSVTIEELD